MQYVKFKAGPYIKNQVFLFKIELLDITPAIWRRIVVPSDYNFWDLHVAIQDSMGWQDRHLHHFDIRARGKKKTVSIGIPDFDGISEMEITPGWTVPIYSHFTDLGTEALYYYDYGDSWSHKVRLEGFLIKEKGIRYPVCVGGERACPPEDCGGPPGYYNLNKVLSDPDNYEYEDLKKWVGKAWNPEVFYKDLIVFDNPFKRWEYAFSR